MKRPLYNAIHSLFYNPQHLFAAFLYRFGRSLPDKLYLQWIHYFETGNHINWENPQRYNEKLQWIKLYDHNPLYTTLVDKYAVKKYVRALLESDSEFTPPHSHVKCNISVTYGVWGCAEEVEWDKLPNQFVLKTNHDSGNNGVFIVKDKSKIDKLQLSRKIDKSLKRDTSIPGREWPYRDVKRCVFAEEYLEDATGELRDYKFFCFDGIVKYLFIATERQSGGEVKFDYFDADFNHLDLVQKHPMSGKMIEKPALFEQMKEVAAKLSKGLPQVRLDLYEVNGRIYFGEYTLFHHNGVVPFHPDKWDFIWGEQIHLPARNV